MADEKPKKLTLQDPVGKEVLLDFNQLEDAQYKIALRMLALEEDKVKLLASSHQIQQQRQRMFEKVLMERGLQPDVPVEIDSKTGALTLLKPPEDPPKKAKKKS
jgi:hypothetical protein